MAVSLQKPVREYTPEHLMTEEEATELYSTRSSATLPTELQKELALQADMQGERKPENGVLRCKCHKVGTKLSSRSLEEMRDIMMREFPIARDDDDVPVEVSHQVVSVPEKHRRFEGFSFNGMGFLTVGLTFMLISPHFPAIMRVLIVKLNELATEPVELDGLVSLMEHFWLLPFLTGVLWVGYGVYKLAREIYLRF